jgi:hypothetical protein
VSPRLQLFIDATRPRTRGDCASVPRPCPYESCRYHLGTKTPESCCLDVADRGEHDLKEVGELMRLTYQRIQQIEAGALYRLADRAKHLRREING